MASNTPFPEFKQTGDDKRDLEMHIEDLTDYCIMQNCFDPSKESDAQKRTKPEKAMACLRASLSPAARTVYKYSLGLDEADQKKPHCVVAALREYYGASIGVSGEGQKFLRLLQNENESIASWETRIRNQAAQCEYEDFADELMRDQFIAGLTSDTLRVKLIGKGHRHRNTENESIASWETRIRNQAAQCEYEEIDKETPYLLRSRDQTVATVTLACHLGSPRDRRSINGANVNS